ncbi:hypothetical protein Ancab_035526, partial [Ancistrocladus abbreviatus]
GTLDWEFPVACDHRFGSEVIKLAARCKLSHAWIIRDPNGRLLRWEHPLKCMAEELKMTQLEDFQLGHIAANDILALVVLLVN